MNYEDRKEPTGILELRGYVNGAVVELPPFAEGQPFVVRLRRPSMLVLAKSGKIPNSLLDTASGLFMNDSEGLMANEGMLGDIYSVMNIVAEAAMVEPTFEQVNQAGLELTDEQLMTIFNYAQSGVKALKSFREESEDNKSASLSE